MVTKYVYSTVACFIKHYCIIQSTFHLPCLLPIPTSSPTSAHLYIPTTHLRSNLFVAHLWVSSVAIIMSHCLMGCFWNVHNHIFISSGWGGVGGHIEMVGGSEGVIEGEGQMGNLHSPLAPSYLPHMSSHSSPSLLLSDPLFRIYLCTVHVACSTSGCGVW